MCAPVPGDGYTCGHHGCYSWLSFRLQTYLSVLASDVECLVESKPVPSSTRSPNRGAACDDGHPAVFATSELCSLTWRRTNQHQLHLRTWLKVFGSVFVPFDQKPRITWCSGKLRREWELMGFGLIKILAMLGRGCHGMILQMPRVLISELLNICGK